MAKRGRVLRDPHQGPGLLMVEGRQYPFLMDGIWRSEVPATPGLVVDVDFDSHGNLNGITAVSQSQARRYQHDPARSCSGPRSPDDWLRGDGFLARLTASAGLLLCWLFLSAVSVHLPFSGRLDLTFWQVLGYLDADNFRQVTDIPTSPDTGAWGFLGLMALAGPFLPLIWKDRWAHLAGILPLSFIGLVTFKIVAAMQATLASRTSSADGLPTTAPMFHTAGIDLGTYLSTCLAIYFGVSSAKQFLAASKTRRAGLERSEKAA